MDLLTLSIGAGVVISLIAALLALVNIFQSTALQQKIQNAEREIEQKSIEFDSMRKEIALAKATGTKEVLPEATAAQAPEGLDTGSHDDGGIQVVRNIGTGFEISDSHAPAHYEEELAQPSGHPTDAIALELPIAEEPSAKKVETQELQQPIDPPFDPSVLPNLSIPGDADVMAVVDPDQLESAMGMQLKTVIIPLYSQSSKDAALEKGLDLVRKAMSALVSPHVKIDFANILFLYDKEIPAISNMVTEILTRGGTLSFVNCQLELKAILRGNPSLAPYIEE